MKWTQNVGKISLALLLAVILGASGTMMVNGSNKLHSAMTHALAETAVNEQQEVVIMDFSNEPENVIYLTGGCFWGIEHLMQSIPGVIDAQSGYANGRRVEDANYQTICYTDTGFRETVRVEYDPEQVSLDALLMAYFYVIDPKLTAEQYDVTQKSGTEYPFRNKFWNQFEKGIYVDIVTGEPLFSSSDKFESSCGWPAFSKTIEEPSIVELVDTSHGMVRTEVRSRAGNTHLGHMFENDPESPNGVRYCINSASLRFIPYAHMETEGYGYLMDMVE